MLKSIHRIELFAFACCISPLEMARWANSFAFGEPFLSAP
jgi:hypothetical protein